MRLALRLLGPPILELNDQPAAADQRKILALLAYLAVNRRPHHRDHLSGLLWPDHDQSKAFTNLRHLLWEIQQAIGEDWVTATRDTIRLAPGGDHSGREIWLDVAEFRSLLEAARAQPDPAHRIPILTNAIKLYRDHFLSGFSVRNASGFNDWSFAESESLRRELTQALSLLADDNSALGQANLAIQYIQRLIKLEPLNEGFHRQLMKLYAQAGQVNAALKQYMTCEKLIRKELGLDPQPETRALYKQIRKGEVRFIPARKSDEAKAPNHNLPYQISKFIGREKERVEIADLIAHNRLTTLTGTGGIGKTRLSLKAGEELLNVFSDGVWFVELASLSDPALVPQTVAKLFHITEQAEESITDKLIRVLRSQSALLILDNCEHLLAACSQLADTLLKNCPPLKILTTSREPLGITGEALYLVPPLGLPDVERMLEKLMEYESIQLFAERARLVQERFALTFENAVAVAQICRRLDGIPLAIELAAARVNILSTEQIASRLDESFNLLTDGNRAALPRQQTLRASIDWSWNLLSEPERIFLRRLSVFAGGWTLESAEVVAENKEEGLTLLDRLVEKSLVLFDELNERYLMLETIRVYARERLVEAKEEARIRDNHLAFFVAMAEQAEPKLLGKEQGIWMKKLSEEQENIITANDWSGRSISRTELGFRLLGGTRYYWQYAGLASLGSRMYREALDRNMQEENTMAVALTHDGVAIYSMHLNDPAIIEHVDKSLPIFQAHGDQVRLAMAFTRKAWGYMLQGNDDAAIGAYEEAIELGRRIADKRPISAALNNLAELFRIREEYEKALPLFEESLAIDREREDSTGIVLGLLNFSRTALMLGSLETVRSQLTEAARIIDETHLREYMQATIETVAVLRFLLGQQQEGIRLFGAAEMELKIKGNKPDPADEKLTAYWGAKMREIVGEAVFSEAMKSGGRMPYEDALAEIRTWLENRQ